MKTNGEIKIEHGIPMTDEQIEAATISAKARAERLRKLYEAESEVRRLEARIERRVASSNVAAVAAQIIIEQTSDFFDATVESLSNDSRETRFTVPRHAAFYLIRKLTSAPLVQIGDMFNRDHGTVINGCRAVEDRISVDRRFASDITELENLCIKAIENAESSTMAKAGGCGG